MLPFLSEPQEIVYWTNRFCLYLLVLLKEKEKKTINGLINHKCHVTQFPRYNFTLIGDITLDLQWHLVADSWQFGQCIYFWMNFNLSYCVWQEIDCILLQWFLALSLHECHGMTMSYQVHHYSLFAETLFLCTIMVVMVRFLYFCMYCFICLCVTLPVFLLEETSDWVTQLLDLDDENPSMKFQSQHS